MRPIATAPVLQRRRALAVTLHSQTPDATSAKEVQHLHRREKRGSIERGNSGGSGSRIIGMTCRCWDSTCGDDSRVP